MVRAPGGARNIFPSSFVDNGSWAQWSDIDLRERNKKAFIIIYVMALLQYNSDYKIIDKYY